MKYLDDESMDSTLEHRPRTSAERQVLADTRRFMERGEFATASPSKTLAFELLAAGGVAVVVIALMLTLARSAPPTRQPAALHPSLSPTAQPTAEITPTVPTVSAAPLLTIPLNDHVEFDNAFDVASGDLWVVNAELPRTGTLDRYDTTTGRRVSTRSVGGDPLGVAVSGGFVWVANGSGDGSARLVDSDTILQFDEATGSLIRTYAVTQPMAVISQSDTAWVLAGGTGNVPTRIVRLQNGHATTLGELPLSLTEATGVYSNLTICGRSAVFATASASQTRLVVFPLSGGPYREVATIPAGGLLTLACNASVAIVEIDSPGSGLFRVALTGGYVTHLASEALPSSVALVNGLFIVSVQQTQPSGQASGYLEEVNPTTGETLPTRTAMPVSNVGDRLVGGDASGVWVAVGYADLVKMRLP
jgi:hypothetical protein